MRRALLVAAVLGATGAQLACDRSPKTSAVATQGSLQSKVSAPGEYLVTLAKGADAKVIEEVYGSLGIKRIKDLGRNVFLVAVTQDPGLARMEELRKQEARIQAVQPNFVYRGG